MQGSRDFEKFLASDNADYRRQLDTINTFTLIAKRYNVPKDVRLLIAQKYIWDDAIPPKLYSFMQKLLMRPYYDEDVKSPLTFVIYVIAQMFAIMLAGAFVYLWDFNNYTQFAFIVIVTVLALTLIFKIPEK